MRKTNLCPLDVFSLEGETSKETNMPIIKYPVLVLVQGNRKHILFFAM